MELSKFKDELFLKAKSQGIDECEIYYKYGESISINVYNKEVEKYNLAKSKGISFRCKINNKIGYSYTEILDEDAIEMLITNAKTSADLNESKDIQFIYKGDSEYKDVKTYSVDLENIDPKKMIDIALEMENKTKNYSNKVINLNGCKISYAYSNYGIFNTKGLELSNKENLLFAYTAAVIKDNNEKYDGVGYQICSSLDEIDTNKLAMESVEDALSKVGARSILSGNYKTIINNEAMVSILETFSSVFSADSAQKGLSLFKDKEGDVVASDIVTIIDDPLIDYGLASASFDDEGVATYKKDLISNGKLNTLLHNLKTSYKAGVSSTGNGFKSSYESQVSVSKSNLYLKAGNKTLDELISEINEGVLITDLAGLHSGANAVSGDFSLAAKGFYIEEGKINFPVEQITLAGNYFDLLKNIREIGSDLKFPVSSVGSPSVIVDGLSIAGK